MVLENLNLFLHDLDANLFLFPNLSSTSIGSVFIDSSIFCSVSSRVETSSVVIAKFEDLDSELIFLLFAINAF